MGYTLISVVVATYNMAETLPQCIDSFLAQTYPYKELIIIDGASNDGTIDILNQYNDSLAYWESEPDRGVYHAWNKAIDHVKGEWICFLGADDFFWNTSVLEMMAEKLAEIEKERFHIVYGQVAIIDSAGKLVRVDGVPWQEAREKLFLHMSLPHPGLMHHKSIFNTHGKFDERFLVAGDYEFLLRELKHGKAGFVPDVITVGMRMGGISTQKRYLLRILLEEALARYRNKINPINAHWLRCMLMTFLSIGAGYLLGFAWLNRLRWMKRRMQRMLLTERE